MIQILPLTGIGEVSAGDDLAGHLARAATRAEVLRDDVIVVTQKVVSKAEGRLFPEDRRAELIAEESINVLRRQGDMSISETRHGFVCANAGVDASNVPEGTVALLPLDPDASARRLRSRLEHLTGARLGVIISDTFGRPWRLGQTDIAIGVAGVDPFIDHVGQPDANGKLMTATRICIADQIAGAAEMVMGKADGICAALVRGAPVVTGRGSATQIVRPAHQDLFR